MGNTIKRQRKLMWFGLYSTSNKFFIKAAITIQLSFCFFFFFVPPYTIRDLCFYNLLQIKSFSHLNSPNSPLSLQIWIKIFLSFYRLYSVKLYFIYFWTKHYHSIVDFYFTRLNSTIALLFKFDFFCTVHNLKLSQESSWVKIDDFCHPPLVETMISAPHSWRP